MPDMEALRQLLSLWDRWQHGEELPWGFTPWRDVFASLREIRPTEFNFGLVAWWHGRAYRKCAGQLAEQLHDQSQCPERAVSSTAVFPAP